MTAFGRLIGLLAAGIGLALAAPATAGNPLASVLVEPGAHRTGAANAKVKLVEYVSYTCSHCANFEQEAGSTLRLAYVASGKVSVETRHLLRDPFDLTAALLANCGPAARFDGNHAMLMGEQKNWLPRLAKATPAQKARYMSGSYKARRQAIASDAGFYPLMAKRGYDRMAIDNCLADDKLAKLLSDKTVAYSRDLGIAGTPSFALDGVVLAGTHDWDSLKFQLDLRL